MSWMLLLQSEYRRIKKAVLTLGTTHPMVLGAVAALAVIAVALAARAGETIFVISFIPGGLSGFTIFILLIGLVSGLSMVLILPREDYFDEQFRSTPVRKIELFMGLRAVPLIFVMGVIAIPTLVMLWRLYVALGVPAAGFWTGVVGILLMSVSMQGASVAEAARGHRSWVLFSLATLAMAGTLVVSLLLSVVTDSPWFWLATYLPQSSLHLGEFSLTLPPVHVAVLGAGISILLSALAWIAYSFRPNPPPRQRGLQLTIPVGKNILTACISWTALTTLRQPHSRNLLAMAIATGIGAMVLLSNWTVSETHSLMVLLTSNMVLYVTALAVLAFSEDREAASWLVKTVPVPGKSIALAWWIPACLLVFTMGSLSALPAVLGFGDASTVWMLMTLLVVYACCTPIIGRVLPWNRRSPSKQLLVTIALIAGVGATYYLFDQIGTLTGLILGSNTLVIPIAGLLLLMGASALSIAIEWADS